MEKGGKMSNIFPENRAHGWMDGLMANHSEYFLLQSINHKYFELTLAKVCLTEYKCLTRLLGPFNFTIVNVKKHLKHFFFVG